MCSGSIVLSGFSGSVSDLFGVNSARLAELRRVDRGLGDIPDDKLVESFVLGTVFAAVGTTDVLFLRFQVSLQFDEFFISNRNVSVNHNFPKKYLRLIHKLLSKGI